MELRIDDHQFKYLRKMFVRYPIYSTTDRYDLYNLRGFVCTSLPQETTICVRIHRDNCLVDPGTIRRFKITLSYRIDPHPFRGDVDISHAVLGSWRGPIKNLTVNAQTSPLVIFDDVRINDRRDIPFILTSGPGSRFYVFDYYLTICFDSDAGKDFPFVNIDFWEVFCRNFSGIHLLSGYSQIVTEFES